MAAQRMEPKRPRVPTADGVPTPEWARTHLNLDWAPRAGSQPRSTERACLACVYGESKHRRWCGATRQK